MLKDKEELNLAKSFILGGITRKKLFFLCEKNETIIINPRIVEKKNVDIESIYEYEEYGLLNKTPSKKQNKLFKLLKKDQKIIYFLDEQILNKEFMGAEFLKRGNNCYYCTKRIETLNNISQTLNDWYNKEYYKLKKKFGLTIKGLRMPWEKNNIFKVYINFNDAEIKHVSFNLNEYFIINVLGNENDKIRKEIWFNINCLSLADSLTTSREIYIENKEDLYKLINDVFIQTKNTKSKYVFRGISHDIEMLPSLYRRGIDIINDKLDIFKLQKNEEKLKKILNYLHIEYKNDMSVKEIEIELLRGICNKIEKESLRKFEQNCALYFTNIDTEYDFISNAQHYGISTRLLDWTFNIYAALLFAIFSNETPDGGYYKVLALDIHEHIYCDKILNIPNGRNLSFNYEKILDFFNSVSTIYNETSYVSKKQIETIFSSSIHESVLKEKYSSIDNKNFKDEDLKLKYIDRLYDKFSEDKFFFVVPPFSNQRIASQQGVLQVILTYDYKKMFAMMKKFSFKININKDLRSELIEQIEKIGHNMFKIMPDLSNNCSTIMKKTMDKINSQILNDIKVECKLSDKKTSVLFLYPIYYDVAHYKSAKRKEIPPFGVMYLASAVKKMGLNVEIRGIDSSYNDIYDFRKYDIVAYSIPSSITYPIMKKVNDIAMYSPKALKIVGGLHPTIYPDSVFKDMHPDVLLMGEGEESIVKVINHYMDRDFSDIEGVYVKNKNITPLKISNLDSIAFPARELMDKEDILIERLYSMNDNRLLKIIHILCSRGCNFRCNFCGNQMRPIRYRSGNNVVQEIELLCEEYPDMEGFCIIDDNFLMENSNVVDIIYQILLLNNKRTKKLKWSALSRVDIGKLKDGVFKFKEISQILTDNEMMSSKYLGIEKYKDFNILELAKEAGCIELKFGLESGSVDVLKYMNKSLNGNDYLFKASETLKMANKLSISTKIFLIYGYPGETAENLKETYDFIKNNMNHITRVSLFSFTPLPGSKIWSDNYKNADLESESFNELYLYDNTKWFSRDQTTSKYEGQLNQLKELIQKINENYEELILMEE